MRSSSGIAIAALCASLAVPAEGAGSTAEELAQIEAQHAVLRARLRLLETQAQMTARQADIDRYAPVLSTATPILNGVDGVGSRLYATVFLENCQPAEIRQGDTLPNGMRVATVKPDEVVVVMPNKTRVRLKPAGDGICSQNAAARAGGFGAAPLPMVSPPSVPMLPPLPGRQGADR